MSGHQSAEAEIEVHVFVAIQIVNVAALAVAHKNRIRVVGAVIAGHSERQALLGSLVRFAGTWRALLVSSNFLFESLVHDFLPFDPCKGDGDAPKFADFKPGKAFRPPR